jgi:hypothetical protein
MTTHECGVIIPRKDSLFIKFTDSGIVCDCVLPIGHYGPHIFRGSGGKYYQWEVDFSCDCCEPEDDDHCFVYGEVSRGESAHGDAVAESDLLHLTCIFMRNLWRHYDHGGHSMRSLKSQVLESALFLIELPSATDSPLFLYSEETVINEASVRNNDPLQLSFAEDIGWLSFEEFVSLVAHVVQELEYLENPLKDDNSHEKRILETICLLLRTEARSKYHSFDRDPLMVIREGAKRSQSRYDYREFKLGPGT